MRISFNTFRKPWRLIGTLSVLLALTGCSQSESATSQSAPESSGDVELVPLTVGVLPIAPSVAVEYGVEEGIFEEYGLDIDVTRANSGAAMLPAVANQQVDIGVGNPLSVLIAHDTGLDIKILTGYSNSLADGDDINGLVTKSDSGIETFADLEGHNVAINQLQSQGDLTIMEMNKEQGGDPAAIEFSEIPFVEMPAHLEQGNVDAIWLPEPFLSNELSNDTNSLVGYPNQEAIPGLPTMVTFAAGDFADEDQEAAELFTEAMTEVLERATDNEEDAKALLTSFMDLPEDQAKSLRMEQWDGTVQIEKLQELADLATEFEYLDQQPVLEDLVVE